MRLAGLVVGLLLLSLVVGVAVVFLWLRLDARRSPRGRLGRAFLVEIAAFVPMQLLLPLGFLLWPWWWRRPRRTGELPVLFLHGYTQSAANFYVLAHRLRGSGRGSLYAANHFTLSGVAASARRLARAVERVRRVTGASRVHLVGHSMGGVVARYFVEHGGGAAVTRSITTICSPLNGTHRARLSRDPSARDMTPRSELLTRIGPPSPPGEVRYHAVWSHADPVVVPAESASLQGAGDELVLDADGHFSPLLSCTVARSVESWLDHDAQEPVKSNS